RWTHHDDSGFIPYAITTGLDYEAMTEQRKGYENFVYQNGVYDLGDKIVYPPERQKHKEKGFGSRQL
ncbi:TPA: hypothetical protein J1749_004271, partial [Escherichia coli]|nr:hypothetical protein [Escherichia coli]